MHQGIYVFSQVMDTVVRYQFNQCVARYGGEWRVRNFSCWEQFLALAFGQLTHRESLRDIIVCLGAQRDQLYHLGFGATPVLSTLARANENRDWRIWRDFAQVLIEQARELYAADATFSLDLDGTVYLIDSTTIELCLSVFKWATFVTTKAAVKVHTLMALKGSIPAFFHISKGNVHDVNFLDLIEYEAHAYYIMDRGYLDYERLYKINQAGANFVTRSKHNTAFTRLYSNQVDTTTGVRCDQVIKFAGYQAARDYPAKLRRIKYFDKAANHSYVFLTNNFNIDAGTIADLYKHRWQIELFFKWIKGHLKITAFWGHSDNAVRTQICIAICSYLIVAIMKKRLNINRNLYEILQILNVSSLVKMPLFQLISEIELQSSEDQSQKQARLWDY
jgi:hypothetical protein